MLLFVLYSPACLTGLLKERRINQSNRDSEGGEDVKERNEQERWLMGGLKQDWFDRWGIFSTHPDLLFTSVKLAMGKKPQVLKLIKSIRLLDIAKLRADLLDMLMHSLNIFIKRQQNLMGLMVMFILAKSQVVQLIVGVRLQICCMLV